MRSRSVAQKRAAEKFRQRQFLFGRGLACALIAVSPGRYPIDEMDDTVAALERKASAQDLKEAPE